jgi:propionyl-CoA synthetase
LTHKYQETFDRSIRDPEGFWEEQSQAVEWTKEWKRGLDPVRSEIEPSQNHWFPGGELNMCDNLLDRHIREGRGANTALIFHSAYTGERETLSFNDLRNRVAHVSGVLQRHGSLGYQKQTETQIALIYMPNSIEAIVAMLACARIGLTHAVVFGGFAAQELATRIRHAKPSIILTASCGIEPKRVIPYKPLLDEALALAGAESTPCIIKQRPQCR